MDSKGNDNHGFTDDGKVGAVTEKFEVEEKKTKTKKAKEKWTCCQIALVVWCLSSVVAGVSLIVAFPYIFDAVLEAKMEVLPGSFSYDLWHYTPIPLYIRFYLFNLTNPDEFTNGAKPVLQEVGPYVYREFHEKINITFNPNDTVTYFQQRWWHWDQEASGNNTQDDEVIILNTVPVSAAWAVRKNSGLLSGLNLFFKQMDENLTLSVPVRQLLFDGFPDPLLDFTQSLSNASLLPPGLPSGLTDYDKFGWFYKRNLSVTYDGKFNMFTGHDTLEHLGVIDWWNESNTTEYFEYPCNVVNGSAGEMWPPGQQKDLVSLYSPDLCMTMTLYYKEETRDVNGLPGYRYWGTNQTLPGDGCYCVEGVCAPSGLVNAESCRMGAPAFVSFPHFAHADPSLLDEVVGLEPDEDIHSFDLDIIPEVGVPMHVTARMQINLLVRPYKEIKILRHVPEVYLPLLWFEEEAVMPHSLAWQLKLLLVIMNTPLVNIIFGCVVALGCIGATLVFFFRYRAIKKSRDDVT